MTKKRWLAGIVLTGALCGAAHAQVVSPAEPVVQAGRQIKLAASSTAVKWSLVPGSAGAIDDDGTYHAPASIPVPHSIGGCQVGAADSIFNTRIDNLPVHAQSAAWMARLPKPSIGISPSWGINVGDHTTPRQKLVFNYTPAYNALEFEIPGWPSLKRESGVFSDPRGGTDRHILTVDRESCRVYDIYNNYPAGTSGNEPPASTYTAQSGWQYQSMSYALPSGGATDAAGMALAPTTITLDDIRSGTIRHALRVTFSNSYIAPAFVWPATGNAGAYGFMPYGTRFRLKADADISQFSPTAQIILTALKQYGMIISDGGSNWDIIGSTDITADRDVAAAVLEITSKAGRIGSNQFEIVDESSLMVSPKSSLINYANRYVKPPVFAIARADDGVHPPVSVPIALQGVGLNSPEGGGIWIQSRVTKSLGVYASGAANPAVTWRMNPALGSLDKNSGVFTAPPVQSPTRTEITATSVDDPSASVRFPVTVMPPGPIRIVAGDATVKAGAPNSHAPDYGPDSEGNMWWRDQAVERAWGIRNDYQGDSFWPAIPDIYRYETQYYNFGDTVYRFFVPNGNYRIDYYTAQGGCGPGNSYLPLQYREHLEAQGQIVAHDFRPLEITGNRCDTPVHTSIPARVEDNSLYFALRHITDSTKPGQDANPTTTITAFSITPTTEAPHLTIDPEVLPALTMSQSVQLYAVGWYMSNRVTWRLESGPGRLDSEGRYIAPPTPATGTAVVKATSVSDPSQTATITIKLDFGAIALSPQAISVNRSMTQRFTASIGAAPYSNIAWTVSPRLGAISPAGVYSAPDTIPSDAIVTINAASRDDPLKSANAMLTIRANASPLRIKCGDGGPLTDAQGNVWAKDYGYSANTVSYGASVPIARATPDMYPLYNSSRYVYENQTFEYNFPLPNGQYEVTLKFADYSYAEPGHYSFDVAINGATVLRSFDPDAVYKASKTAVDKTFVTSVSNKTLRISFLGRSGAAFINGIQILPVAGQASVAKPQ